ncbi:MAG: iron-containing alcohol dehydrogenase [Pontiellaceae bacterium]|nr:iron-containing alcohol dehydrogenase [Pontiellaceae bacterium]MBN2785088.1 iron-containing alcohol dehydrogenase [Pontiellaceae bacterium]
MTKSHSELRKFVAPEFIYGVGALDLTGRYARHYGARRALIVTDPGIIEAGWMDQVRNSLLDEDIKTAVFDELTPNPKDYEVENGCRCYDENDCDIIIAVGGGSPMDCAKGIGVSQANRCNVRRFEGVDEVPMPGPPLICIPTTAGTSADVSQFAIITDTDRHIKMAIVSKTVVPDVALIDPQTTLSMPADLTACTGMDALVHAIESYVSNASSPITDLNALEAIRLISRNLKNAITHPEDLYTRGQLMTASLLAGLAFSNASLGLVHAMAHAMGGLLDSPHGRCNALLLEKVVEFNYPAASERYNRIAEVMGAAVSTGSETILEQLDALRESVGIEAGIRNMGISPDTIPQLAANAFHDACAVTNPREATEEDICIIYEKSL